MSTDAGSSPRMLRAAELFKFGNDAALKSNFDYAIQMFREACKIVPENLIYRQALRGIERRKFQNEPSKVGRLVGVRLQPIKLQIKASKTKSKWTSVIEGCEDAFVQNPWDVGCAEDLAEAAEQLGLKELARWAMESVRPQVTNDAGFLRHMAHVYELNADFQKAIGCWEEVRKLIPHDEEARRQVNQLSATATINRSGLGDALSKPRGVPEPTETELNELRKEPAMTDEQRYEKEIADNPTRIHPYLNLADILRQAQKLDAASKVLERGVKANPDDQTLRSALADVQMSRLNRAVEAWEKKSAESPGDAEAQARLAHIREKRDAFELQELRRRVEKSPEDLALRLQLGARLLALKQVDAAIAEFQFARNGATKVEALFQLGQAFEAKNLPKLAERNYNEALKFADADDSTIQNKLHYHLGRIAEAMGDRKSAEEHYNEVAANDFSYLDVARRLEDLNRQA